MDDYISKPVELKVLAQVLEVWSRKVHQQQLLEVSSAIGNGSGVHKFFSTGIEGFPPVDLEYLDEITGGDRAFQLEVLDTFTEDALACIANMKATLQEPNAIALSKLAHQLKGASSTAAIRMMPDIAKQIETQAKDNHLEGIDELVLELEAILEKVTVFKTNVQLPVGQI